MRTFEQRMAEIKSRSETLIRRRKKRRIAILTTCIPLVLTLVLVGGRFLFPDSPTESEAFLHEGTTAPELAPDEVEIVEEGMTLHATFVETVTAPSGSYTDYEGVSVEALSMEQDADGIFLRIKWKNETDKEVIFGSAFYIDAFRGGTWIPCNVNENLTFTAIAYVLAPNSEREETYRLTGTYDLPTTGTCRFRADCFVYTTPEETTPCTLWTTFQAEQ